MQFQLMDKNSKIPVDLFCKDAEEIANEVYKGQQATRGKANKPTQIRKFYDEVVSFDTRLRSADEKTKNDEFQAILPYLKMLNAKAAYAEARELITREFRDFLSQGLKQITTPQSFQVFVHLFEAFMGYYKYLDVKQEAAQGTVPPRTNNSQVGRK
ncbi:MAG TPA: type III-A CRISPR-associated protein Csm2 [Candidatus Ozemobacteraceae bacterium]|nr:type III-A CRISPR-associated protein Csm2 [Candidatus Ozemobacteraceae bacterium]